MYDAYISGPRDLFREAEVLTDLLTKNLDRTATGERDRTGTWSASSAGRCLREQQFTFLGMPQYLPGPKAQNIFLNGDYVHLRYQVAGLITGWLEDAEVPLLYGRRVRGTTDGLTSWNEVFEAKSINARGFAYVKDTGPKEDHKKQVTGYMIASNRPATRFVYENKDTNEAVEFYYELEQHYVDAIELDWKELDEYTDQKKLFPMLPECKDEKGAYRWCDFSRICKGANPWPKVSLVSD